MPVKAWREKHAGVKLAELNRVVDRMVGVARTVKDANRDDEVQRSELKAATRAARVEPKFAALMETIRSASGWYARDLNAGGNPYYSHNQFVGDYRSLKNVYKQMDTNHDGSLDARELNAANSKKRQAVIEYAVSSRAQPPRPASITSVTTEADLDLLVEMQNAIEQAAIP